MNQRKRALLQFQAAFTRRLARQVKPLYAQPDLYGKAERTEINAQYAKCITPADAAQQVLGMRPNQQARIFRAMCCCFNGDWNYRPASLYGNAYTEKMVMLSAVHRGWFEDHQVAMKPFVRLTLSFFHPKRKPTPQSSTDDRPSRALEKLRDMVFEASRTDQPSPPPVVSLSNVL